MIENTRDSFASKIKGINIDLQKYDHMESENCTAESFPNESNSIKNREPKHVQASISPHTTVNDMSLSSLDLLTPIIALSDISNRRKQKYRKKQPQIAKWEKVAQSASLGDFLEALSGEKCTQSSNNVHCELPSKKEWILMVIRKMQRYQRQLVPSTTKSYEFLMLELLGT